MEEREGVGGGQREIERDWRGGERESMDGEERDLEWTYIIREPEPVCTAKGPRTDGIIHPSTQLFVV